jgi:adenine phosphoribosyltransferase
MELETFLKSHITDMPDFPKPGILFRDITTLIADGPALKATTDAFAAHFAGKGITKIVAPEARGFIFGTALGYAMGVGVVLVRKPGKLPRATNAVSYELEYGTDTLHMHADALTADDRVLIIDDVLATGGTAEATVELVQLSGATVGGAAFVIELDFLAGRNRLAPVEVFSLVHY